MARWTQYLTDLLPRTGRVINERGESVNQADVFLSNIGVASLDGRMCRGFINRTIAAGATEVFVLDVPAGVDLIGFVRTSQVRDSTLITRFLSVTDFVSAQGPIDGLSLDRRDGRRSISEAKIHRASSVTGRLVHSPDIYLYVGTSQATRNPSVQTETGALPAFDVTELPAFEYQNDTASAAVLDIYLFWQELPSS